MAVRRKKKSKAPRRVSLNQCRVIVVIDARPVRDEALRECRRSLRRLEKVRSEFDRFEQEDTSAFERWKAAHFGDKLTQINDLNREAEELERLQWEVEEVAMWEGCSSKAAYRRVMRSREEKDSFKAAYDKRESEHHESEFEAEEEPEPKEEFDEEFLFRDTLRNFFGINPDSLPKAEYKNMFHEFKQATRGGGFGQSRTDRRAGAKLDIPSRVKELYRTLVRRLHPDANGVTDAAHMRLWHQVQEAYAAGDADRLETLLAYTDIQKDDVGESTTLGQLRAVAAELRSAIRAVEKSLRAARKTLAWGFAARTDRKVLQEKMESELGGKLTPLRKHVEALRERIAKWRGAANPKPRKNSKFPPGQPEFSF